MHMFKTILSILGLVLAGGIFFAFTQPNFEGIRALETQIDQYDEALAKAAELQQIKQSLLSRYNAFNPNDVSRLQKLLPDHVDNVRLVLDLDSLAVRHGMALQNVVISGPTSSETAPGVIAAAGGSRQKYDSLTLKFRTQGTYQNFTVFLEDLESSLRVVDLVSLSLERVTGTQLAGEPLYRYDITIRTYWLK